MIPWRISTLVPLLVPLFFLSSCATEQFAYVPSDLSGQKTEHTKNGKASYQVPPEAPTGTVRIRSGGIVKLKPNKGGAKVPALHVRVVLANQSSPMPWNVDPRALTVSFPNGEANVAPIFVQSHSPTTPVLVVSQGEMRSLDLYYALPEEEKSAKELPEFNFQWEIHVGPRLVQETTSFDRVTLPSYDYGAYPYPYDGGWEPDWGWGPDWGMGWGMGWGGWGPGYWGGGPMMEGPMMEGPAMAPSRPVIVGH